MRKKNRPFDKMYGKKLDRPIWPAWRERSLTRFFFSMESPIIPLICLYTLIGQLVNYEIGGQP